MLELLPLMIERVGILIILAFLLSRMKTFRQFVQNQHGFKEKLIFIFIFGSFGIISNYTGVEIESGVITTSSWQTDDIDGAIANTRIMGVTIGGLLGGPLVGIGVGLIAGLHRLTLGGFTAVACALSTILAGVVTGLLGKYFHIPKNEAPWKAVVAGIIMEGIQMGIILLIARPIDEAVNLVKLIAFPMIAINGFGTLLFLLIIQNILVEEERTRALQTHKALYIAQQTLPFFRKGLTAHSSEKVAEIILNLTNADAISITNRYEVLAHVGAGSDHHKPMYGLSTLLTKRVIEQGRIITAHERGEIGCVHEDCPLRAAIVLPLQANHETVGSLKLYYTTSSGLSRVEQELAEGLSKLFSTQLELAEVELQRKLLKDAEIKALQAQVHPHFLFNSINTISSLIRTDTVKARKLLINLGIFFRSNLQGARQILIPLEKELEHVEAYLSLEQARFPNKYYITVDIDPALRSVLIPPFTLQPLVENAIRHAFTNRAKGEVVIKAFLEEQKMFLVTEDNGKGVPPELIHTLGHQTVKSSEGTGTALWNIKKRIEEIYGLSASFTIENGNGSGTRVSIVLPMDQTKWGEEYVESFYSG